MLILGIEGGLSRDFWSAEILVRRTKITSKNGLPGLIFPGKIGPTLKYLVRVRTKITGKRCPPGPSFPVLSSTTAGAAVAYSWLTEVRPIGLGRRCRR